MQVWHRVRVVLVCGGGFLLVSCASEPQSSGHKKMKLETIDHGPNRPKTYLYREVQ